MPSQPAAFVSYVRFNDQHDEGWVSQFCERLSAEIRVQLGDEFPIFQDRKDIAWGQSWQQRIDQALDAVTLLLVIITPGFFRSSACRAEVERFLARERDLGRADLILPLYYVSTPEMDDPERRDADELAKVLASRQFADWRGLRFEPLNSPRARKAVAQLAARMRDTFWRQAGRSGSTETAPVAGPAKKTGPPTHVANPSDAGRRAGSSEGTARPLEQAVRELEIFLRSLQRGSGDSDLARLVREYPARLSELIRHIGQYDGPTSGLSSYLYDADSYLRNFPELVAHVRRRARRVADRGFEPTEQLAWLDDLIRQARDAVSDLKTTIESERAQRHAEREHKNLRSNKRFREDQQELRSLARAAEALLKELRRAMDPLFAWFRGCLILTEFPGPTS